MSRRALLLLILSALAARAFDIQTASTDDLIAAAVRYGDTDARRADKAAARDRLFEDKPATLRRLMELAHLENVGIQVLAHNTADLMTKEEAVPVLLDFVDAPRTNTQRLAVYFLGLYRAPEQADRIRPLLASERVRGLAIRTLGRWRAATPQEIAACLRDPNERVRVAAANAARDTGDPRAIPDLLAALSDPYFTVRNTALRALVSMGAPAERALLAELPRARGPALRQIIRGLGELRARAAVRPLRALLEHEEPGVREDARRALALIGS